jgi:hypothetical protein
MTSNAGNPLVDGRGGGTCGSVERLKRMLRFKEREIAIVFVKGMLYFCSCEPYSTSNKTEY